MAKGKYKQKKSPSDAKRYRNSLGENRIGISETYKSKDTYLVGSDDVLEDYSNEQSKEPRVARKPISLVLRDWLRDNWISIIVTILIIPFCIWIVHSIFEIEKNAAIRDYRIDELERDISELSDEMPNKESLEIQLDTLKEDMKYIDEQDLERRINDLEQIVDQYH